MRIKQESFDEAVRFLADQDGTDAILDIPGVWAIVSEHYNNEAIDRAELDKSAITWVVEERDDEDCPECNGTGREDGVNPKANCAMCSGSGAVDGGATITAQCDSDDEAVKLQQEEQSVCGSSLERDDDMVYMIVSSAAEAVTELRAAGYKVEVRS